ncbi:hypothetical protein [Burkholderia cenocepacia]|uniref:hypothetical protein n=1 Tax=Burkholderia cenocepacia TaxID=95486 RepID=UPI00222E820F|nr:hypothetical protein [Burkholderia cenocepacia]MCW3504359.1 hypothetical protein [Burkholderia cenocepacia]MCW3511821.1 hypothetical protein [Burkholderia cenocepacia]MCW3519437.1 hypothetical protein [Burkholderia cenocepacia]MCW3534695.1 hypothetical protein [Burkholderia cenocepacia]MCW3549846.1 hypothetical protein [Burkholderia cenocepacia]
MTKQTNPETLGAAEFAEMLEAARRSKAPAAELLKVADVMAAVPAWGYRAEEIRFAAKRLEANPWDSDAAQTIAVRLEDFKSAARMAKALVDPATDPLTVPHNLTFPLAPGRTPDEPMRRDTTRLTGRNPFYGRS